MMEPSGSSPHQHGTGGGQGGKWTIAAASEAGLSHRRASLPCQDAHGYRVLRNGWLIVAVADGAGSATFADVGATNAVRIALNSMEDQVSPIEFASRVARSARHMDEPALHHEVTMPSEPNGNSLLENPAIRNAAYNEMPPVIRHALQQTLFEVRAGVEGIASEREIPVRELASTLLLSITTPEWIGAVQVGDGAIVGWDRNGGVFVITRPPDTEYANATTFLCSPDGIETAQWAYVHPEAGVDGIAIFSDGLQRLALKMPEGEPHFPFFSPLINYMRSVVSRNPVSYDAPSHEISAFLRSPRIQDRTDDDLTLVLAHYENGVTDDRVAGEQG